MLLYKNLKLNDKSLLGTINIMRIQQKKHIIIEYFLKPVKPLYVLLYAVPIIKKTILTPRRSDRTIIKRTSIYRLYIYIPIWADRYFKFNNYNYYKRTLRLIIIYYALY